jgi:hypothetical protein
MWGKVWLVAETPGGVSALVQPDLCGTNNNYVLLKDISRVGTWPSSPTRFFFAAGGQVEIKWI